MPIIIDELKGLLNPQQIGQRFLRNRLQVTQEIEQRISGAEIGGAEAHGQTHARVGTPSIIQAMN
jgi:hypothetical protein